jgi:tetratricopeptide (TPR) repeat protein
VDTLKLAEEGLKYLREGDYDKSRRLFNAAIKFSPNTSNYHLFTAIAYHLEFLRTGSPDAYGEALTGYGLAARLSPTDPNPVIHMGQLYMDAKDYDGAAATYAAALEKQPKDPEILYGLAASSYLMGDLKTALWCAQELETQGWRPAKVHRLRAILYAAGGEPRRAKEYRDAYARSLQSASSLDDDGAEAASLPDFDRRLGELGENLSRGVWLHRPGSEPRLKRTAFADAASMANAYDAPVSAISESETASAKAASAAPTMRARQAWYDCEPSTAGGARATLPGLGTPTGTVDETSYIGALPPPCVGAPPPRMAVIDAVLLRTEDQIDKSYGLNLLQGLTGFFGYATTNVIQGATRTITHSTLYGVGGPAATGLAAASPLNYSLNIANALDSRNEVLARPTLLAVDRVPSTFFSGSTESIAVGGGVAGSVSTLVDRQIGVSFSITPTFIDDDHMLLTVKAVRSFIEPPTAGTTGVALETSRNAVTASLVTTFGDTVVLSGLTERELVRTSSGVPILKDIPAAQYVFANKSSTDFFRTIMIMITVRKPVTNLADIEEVKAEQAERERTGLSPIKKYAFFWRIEEFDKFISKYAPNLDTAIDTLDTNQLYRNFKSKDLTDTNWASKPRLQVLVHDLHDALYH